MTDTEYEVTDTTNGVVVNGLYYYIDYTAEPAKYHRRMAAVHNTIADHLELTQTD